MQKYKISKGSYFLWKKHLNIPGTGHESHTKIHKSDLADIYNALQHKVSKQELAKKYQVSLRYIYEVIEKYQLNTKNPIL